MNTLTIQRLPQTTALMGVILSLLLLLTGLPAAAERTVTYFHSDAAGSVVAASNAAGDLLWRKHYAPYGQQLSGSDTTEPTAYAGHVHDQDIGLTYMKARYYDPQAGRFLGVDPAGVSESNPLSFNRYAYANNNPYKYVDPDGRVGKLINGGIKLIKHGGNPKKAGKEFIADVADSVTTLVDPSASAVDKGLAAFDLVSPVGTQDIKKLADATKGGERAATGFKGSKGFELKNAPYQKVRNEATTINGREFSGHALDQMQNRGIMPSVVENTLKTGTSFKTRAGTTGFYDAVNKVRVITNSETGTVVTVIRGAPK